MRTTETKSKASECWFLLQREKDLSPTQWLDYPQTKPGKKCSRQKVLTWIKNLCRQMTVWVNYCAGDNWKDRGKHKDQSNVVHLAKVCGLVVGAVCVGGWSQMILRVIKKEPDSEEVRENERIVLQCWHIWFLRWLVSLALTSIFQPCGCRYHLGGNPGG